MNLRSVKFSKLRHITVKQLTPGTPGQGSVRRPVEALPEPEETQRVFVGHF